MIVHSRDDIDFATATDQSCSEYKYVLYPPIVSAKFHLILFKYEPMLIDDSVFYNSKIVWGIYLYLFEFNNNSIYILNPYAIRRIVIILK
jgi:hypothetical protein